MNRRALYEITAPGLFHGCYVAQVTDIKDPDNQARVQVRLVNFDGEEDQDGPIWARLAVALAGNPERLKMLRSGMRERLRGSPLMDEAGFNRDLERALREMWKSWVEGDE